MDRKAFLKSACGLGACGCALHLLGVDEPLRAAATTAEVPDQRLAFARYQVAKMTGFMAAGPAARACAEVLQQTGRECAKLGQINVKFKGDPDGYFAAARKNWGTDFSWNKEKGIVTVAVAEGECSCPLVDSKRTPAFFCNCSVGYQKEAFEAIFGKPVQVSLKESKLGGSKRCVFEVTLSQPPADRQARS
jgi:predicted hydrocarbon binding protein